MDNERLNELSGKTLDTAFEVHRILGPGLLEIVYENCLCKEIALSNIAFKRQALIPIIYKECSLNHDLKLEMLVEDLIVVELKSVEIIHPVFIAQLLSHLKLTNKKLVLLINFNVPKLIEGFKRIIN